MVTGYECGARTVDSEFLLTKNMYHQITGREQGKSNIIAYHIRQAFKPGEITPEDANQIGYDLAMRFTKGKHAFIVATHIDREHCHSHIVFNSTTLDAERKFVNFWGSSKALRRLSDVICLENGLSVIENPKRSRKSYNNWLDDNKKLTDRQKLEQIIDKVLAENPTDFDEFIKLLESENCEFKHSRRSVRLEGKKGFLRLNSLSDNYTEEAVRERISGKRSVPNKPITPETSGKKFSLIIDLQNSIKAQNSPGYEHWAKIHNLKQAAKTLMFLQENNLDDMEVLDDAAQKAKDDFNGNQSRIKAIGARLEEIENLQRHIGAYSKTKDVLTEYQKLKSAGKKKVYEKFYADNKSAITRCREAKKFFDEQNLKKLPTIQMLKQEYAESSAERKKLYSGQGAARTYMQEILMARQNVRQLLNYRGDITNQKNIDRGER